MWGEESQCGRSVEKNKNSEHPQMILHHDNIFPWRTTIKVVFAFLYAMNIQKMFLQRQM
jgi:hypothetical protein